MSNLYFTSETYRETYILQVIRNLEMTHEIKNGESNRWADMLA